MAAETIPHYPNQAKDQIVYVSKSMDSKNTQLNINTANLPYNDTYFVYVLKDNQVISKERMNQDRSGFIAHAIISNEITGYIEIYFSNGNGKFISNYGRNFHFILD